MSGLVISGDISGTVTISAPVNANNVSITLPNTSGTMSTTDSSGNLYISNTVYQKGVAVPTLVTLLTYQMAL